MENFKNRTGHKWTQKEENLVLELYKADKSLAAISSQLNRSELSVRTKMAKMNLIVHEQKASKKVAEFVPQENIEARQAINSVGRRNLEFFLYNKYVDLMKGDNGWNQQGLTTSQACMLLAIMDALQSSACHFEEPVKCNDLLAGFYKSIVSSYSVKCPPVKDAFLSLGSKPFWTIVGRTHKEAVIDRDLQMLMLDKTTSEKLRTFLLSKIK